MCLLLATAATAMNLSELGFALLGQVLAKVLMESQSMQKLLKMVIASPTWIQEILASQRVLQEAMAYITACIPFSLLMIKLFP